MGTAIGATPIGLMARFRILNQGQESNKDEWYAQCLYGEHDTDVTVIISGQVLGLLKSMGVSSFPAVVEAALEEAEEVDWNLKQVVVFMDSPIFRK